MDANPEVACNRFVGIRYCYENRASPGEDEHCDSPNLATIRFRTAQYVQYLIVIKTEKRKSSIFLDAEDSPSKPVPRPGMKK
jgi:hypothetical protein